MSHTLKPTRRAARFRAIAAVSVLFGASACDGDRPSPLDTDQAPTATLADRSDAITSAAVSFAGGIPIGTFGQPATAFGALFNGAKLTLKPWELLPTLAIVKQRGGRVVLALAGSPAHFLDGSGHFDLNKWKARTNRFRNMNFTSYITDGTIVGNYLIDEPNDPSNWNGKPIPPSVVEEMAKYSKTIWKNLPTIVRTESSYLAQWSGTYQHLDAAWAQYVHRKGEVGAFLKRNVDDANRKGLALVVGLNILRGGPNRTPMTASQVQTWGLKLLSSSYPCAFLSWEYNVAYLSSTAMKQAMSVLRAKAQNRNSKTCGGS
jgi:hypothetical protein